MGNHSSSVSRCGTYIGIFGIIEMNIQTVAENLRNTIAGKEAYLARENENRKSEDAHVRMVAFTVVKMLEINIDELRRILQDVEQCIEETA